MCYSAQSSMETFVFSMICVGLLFWRAKRYDRMMGAFLFSICLMQLAEYLMWIDQDCTYWNNIGTRLGFVTLCLQPFLLSVFAYGQKHLSISREWLIPLIAISAWALLRSLYLSLFVKKNLCSVPGKRSSHYLVWDLLHKKSEPFTFDLLSRLSYYAMVVPLLILKPVAYSVMIFSFFLLLLVYALLKLGLADYFSGVAVGWQSFWCWMCNLFGVYALVLGRAFFG